MDKEENKKVHDDAALLRMRGDSSMAVADDRAAPEKNFRYANQKNGAADSCSYRNLRIARIRGTEFIREEAMSGVNDVNL